MLIFESILGLLLGAVLLAQLARLLRLPYPSLLALGGAGLAFLPVTSALTLDPELALVLFVAPVLLDAAFDASPRDLRDNWLPISGLVLVAVGLTTAGVATLVHSLLPAMPWAAAIALGAIVAPPDASAASAVLRQIGLPHRVLVILEGESLLNDASALLIYRLAVSAAITQSFAPAQVLPTFALVVVGSLVLGAVVARLWVVAMDWLQDAPSAVIVQFVGAFAVWLLAERLHLSGIITIVTFAMVVARYAPARTEARLRVPTYAVWETTVFVLQALAFVLIGLQIGPILEGLSAAEQRVYLGIAVAVLAAVVLIRLAWVLANYAVSRAWPKQRATSRRSIDTPSSLGGGIIIGWSGMRGIVTLAAAYALPAHFPFRELIVLCAFTVVVGTLVLQGTTLRPLAHAFNLRDGDPVGHEVERARAKALKAALAAIDGDTSPAAESLRSEYRELLSAGAGQPDSSFNELRRRALGAARQASLDLRDSGEIGDDAFHRLEEELDWAELSAAPRRT